MIEPPNATLSLLLLAHVQAGAFVPIGDLPDAQEVCEGCGEPLDDDVFDKCPACVEATECMACGTDVGTEEIGRNDGECDKCAAQDIDDFGL